MKHKKKIKKKRTLWRLIFRNRWTFLLSTLLLLYVANIIVQIYKKPTEVLSLIYPGEAGDIHQTWYKYRDVFTKNSTELVKPETLAAIAQVESSGRIWASPEWKWKLTDNVSSLFSPASSAIGIMQITSGHQQSVGHFCKNEPESSPLCQKRQWWTRLLPSHSVHLAATYIDKTIRDIKRRTQSSLENEKLIELAAITHLCGEKKAWAYVKNKFRFHSFSKCGSHDARNYVHRVKRLQQRLTRL